MHLIPRRKILAMILCASCILVPFLFLQTVHWKVKANPFLTTSVPALIATWNVPSSACSRKFMINMTQPLIENGILVNHKEDFIGNEIAVLYTKNIGDFPRLGADGQPIAGGVPQNGNIAEHLIKVASDITRVIPDPAFGGLGIIDWEDWRPVWELNWTAMRGYRKMSINLVRQRFPKLSRKEAEAMAKAEFTAGAKNYMLSTIRLAKILRPKAQWCYYGFPSCYSVGCKKHIKQYNVELAWLWEESTALCPSVYYQMSYKNYTEKAKFLKTDDTLLETFRLRSSSHQPIHTYVNVHMTDSTLTDPGELARLIKQVATLGINSVLLWGSSHEVNSREKCNELDSYVTKKMTPMISQIIDEAQLCSKEMCSGHGTCVSGDRDNAFHLVEKQHFYDIQSMHCRCYQGYTGNNCEVEKHPAFV